MVTVRRRPPRGARPSPHSSHPRHDGIGIGNGNGNGIGIGIGNGNGREGRTT